MWLADRNICIISRGTAMFLKPERKLLTCEKSLEKDTLIFSGNRMGKKGTIRAFNWLRKGCLRIREFGELEVKPGCSCTIVSLFTLAFAWRSRWLLLYLSVLSFFFDAGNWTQSLECARYTLYHLAVVECVNREIKHGVQTTNKTVSLVSAKQRVHTS